jgi:nitroimidazol reductase NimA-like FMN-containing flavoprotein (pyridoxamine 5'-phosphate oxidase superfamily)
MVSWKDVGADAPEFARRIEQALARGRHLTMATLRADGAPRISGTEIEVSDGELWVGSMPAARKALDLRRDPRVAIHGPTSDPPDDPKGWIGEAKVAGRAVEVPHDDASHRFRIDVEEAVLTHLNDAGDRLVIESWHPGRGVEVVERE